MVYKITAIKVQKRNPQRVNIFFDGEFGLGLSRITAAWLEVGQEINDGKITALQAEDEREVAYQRAIKFISYRIRTEEEIKRHLIKHQVPSEIIPEILIKLQRSQLVDDEQFAKRWVENRSEFRPRALRMLAYELRKKGVADATIDKTLDGTSSDEVLALKAARKQARKYEQLEWPDFRRKMSGFLARRGFSYHIISLVMDQVWAERKSSDSTSGTSNQEVIS